MSILPSTWEAAQAAIAAAIRQPQLVSEERSLGQRLASELDAAIRRYRVGTYSHASVSPEGIDGLGAPIATVEQAQTLLARLRFLLEQHFASAKAHWKPVPRTIDPGLPDFDLANACKAQLNAHVVEVSVHFNNDTTISTPNATDDPSLIALAEALRARSLAHLYNAGSLTFTRTAPDASRYRAELAAYNALGAKLQGYIALADRVARAAATAFGYTSGVASDEPTPWSPITEPSRIRTRLANMQEAGLYSTHPYYPMVQYADQRLSEVMSGQGPAPTPPGQTMTIVGEISSNAEAALNAAINAAQNFAAAAAVK